MMYFRKKVRSHQWQEQALVEVAFILQLFQEHEQSMGVLEITLQTDQQQPVAQASFTCIHEYAKKFDKRVKMFKRCLPDNKPSTSFILTIKFK
jgi:uncharacterized protein (DUF305 family)